tara:strand:+ start:4081 stop:4647 length:567 start_codon:yes stop_codon:yes gene_type:complete
MIKQEINEFCNNWLNKANNIDDSNLQGAFDKFFTLYVVYNRLYVETTYRLSNNGQVNLGNSFPDRKASINYVVQYLKSNHIDKEFKKDENVIKAIEKLKEIIKKNQFNIKLHLVTAEPQPEKDAELLKKMESNKTDIRICAILEYLYLIRCNIFHAQKGYNDRQIKVLKPTIKVLEKIIGILFTKLNN